MILQPLSEFDINFMKELAAIHEYYKYDRDTAQSDDEIEKECQWFFEKIKFLPNKGAIKWITIYDNVKIGEVHINCNWEKTCEWEIGWHFLPEYWGKGFATEATKSVIKYAFTHFNIHRLIALCCTENIRSAVLAERVNMLRDGRMRENILLKGIYYDEYVYSILKHEVIPEL